MKLKNLINYLFENKNLSKDRNDIWYHTTSKENLDKIMREGLKTNSKSKFSMGSLDYLSSIYGRVPLFFSKRPDLYRNPDSGDDLITLKVDLSGIPKLADIPTLASNYGAHVEEDHIWFEEGIGKIENIPNDDGMIYYRELLNPKSEECLAAIDLTKTCAVMQNINSELIKLF